MLMSPKEFTKDEIQRIYLTKTYLLNNLDKKLTISQLAMKSALNKQRFREGFYLLFSYDVDDYIKEARMQLGFLLLKHTDKTMKEIAWLTGFVYSKNFMTAFRKWFGVTAGSVRKPFPDLHF